ncbi:hypothetical protein [Flavobacterium araucananum]|nr:hypothetical protein [Flavobacterium araucananum]
MKKLILLVSLIIMVACSSTDGNDSGKNSVTDNYFNPPTWIQGTWKEDTTGAILIFTTNDIKYSFNNNTTSFSREITKFSYDYPQQISSTSNLYIVDFTQGLKGTLVRFNFVNESGTKIKSQGYLAGNYTKQ